VVLGLGCQRIVNSKVTTALIIWDGWVEENHSR
jgi:hypothetical protein